MTKRIKPILDKFLSNAKETKSELKEFGCSENASIGMLISQLMWEFGIDHFAILDAISTVLQGADEDKLREHQIFIYKRKRLKGMQ